MQRQEPITEPRCDYVISAFRRRGAIRMSPTCNCIQTFPSHVNIISTLQNTSTHHAQLKVSFKQCMSYSACLAVMCASCQCHNYWFLMLRSSFAKPALKQSRIPSYLNARPMLFFQTQVKALSRPKVSCAVMVFLTLSLPLVLFLSLWLARWSPRHLFFAHHINSFISPCATDAFLSNLGHILVET